jgi:hypothetical protein
MTRIRSKRQRTLGFDALEGRLALSAGMGMAVASHHAAAAVTTQAQMKVSASFKGHATVINGSTVVFSGLSGTVGNVHLVGAGAGTLMGNQFEGGRIVLLNSTGSILLRLGPAFVVKVGMSSKQEVSVAVVSATGKLAQYAGAMGTLTTWNIPANPKALASVSGFFIL